jgi:hypothetical protein
MTYRILVTGSRTWTDHDIIRDTLTGLWRKHGPHLTVVHGHCPTGADHHAHQWAHDHARNKVTAEPHSADWRRLGRRAGPIRNAHMVKLGAHICLAFILDGSSGATSCLAMANKAGIPCFAWMTSTAVTT